MIDIKDIQGNIILSVPVTESAQKVEELMSNDYIQLSWNSESSNSLPLGSYIEYEGERYSLIEPYTPSQKNEVEFVYTPQFMSMVMAWGKMPFFFYSGESKEPDWTLTSNPADFMRCICDSILDETGESWSYSIDASLPASASLSFTSVDILSGLNQIAGAFETEWFADKSTNTIYLGLLSHGSFVTLEVGKNINVPSVQGSKEGYYTRFYAFGSTRNITQDYEGSNTNNLVNKRLTLDPTKYPSGYKDIRSGLSEGEIFSKVLIFDDVYPSANLSISGVRNRLMYRLDTNGDRVQVGTDSEGNPIYDQYAIWYFRIEGFDFDISNIIEGYNLSVSFQSGALQGREFELKYYDNDTTITTSDGLTFEAKAGDYEILFIEEGTYIIPSMTGLVPSDGDSVILFNIKMPSEYTQSAYTQLEERLDKEVARMSSDLNNYTFKSNPVAFNENNPNLSIGRSVRFVNGDYSYNTRVIKLTTHLDFPIEQEITIGNEKVKGNTQQLKEEVASANKDLNLLAVFNDMTQNIQQSYNRTQQMILEGFAAIKNIWQLKETSDGEKYAWSAFNIVTQKGITSYADGALLDLPGIYNGLPIDNQTLYWEETTEETTDEEGNVITNVVKVLKAKVGSGSGDGVSPDLSDYATKEWTTETIKTSEGVILQTWMSGGGNAITSISLGTDKKSLVIEKNETFATQDWVTDLINNSGGSGGGGTDSGSLSVSSSGDGNAFTSYTYINGTLTLIKGSTFALQSDLNTLLGVVTNKLDKSTFETWKSANESLIANGNTAYGWGNHADAGYATEDWVTGKGYLTSHQTIYNLTMKSGTFSATTFDPNGAAKTVNIPTTTDHITEGSNLFFTEERVTKALGDTLSKYVDLTSSQTIKGKKDFTGGLLVNGVELVYDKTNKYWKLEGDLLVTGGITSFASDTAFTPSTIMDALVLDSSTLKINDEGQLTVIGGTGGGTSDSVAWGDITGKPSWIGSTKPSYSWTEITSKPSWIGSTKPSYSYSEITGTPTSLKNPYALTFGTKTYDGSSAKTILASDLGALTAHQTIYDLKFVAGKFSALTFDPNGDETTVNIPTTTAHITETYGGLYFTNQRAIDALKDTLTNYVDLTSNQEIGGEKNFTGSLMVNGSKIEYNAEDGYWKFNGNMLITGGLTTYSTDGNESPFMVDAASIDLITSESTTQVYTARATKLIKDEVISVGTDASSALAKLAIIKSELASITDTSLISVIRTALINIREKI